MNNTQSLEHFGVEKHSIFWDIFWTLITLGLFNFWVQIRQIQDTNAILKNDNYSFVKVFIFSLLTLGLYFCYHEYKLTKTLMLLVHNDESEIVPLISAFMTFLGLWFIVDSFQQNLINDYLKQLDQYPDQSVDQD